MLRQQHDRTQFDMTKTHLPPRFGGALRPGERQLDQTCFTLRFKPLQLPLPCQHLIGLLIGLPMTQVINGRGLTVGGKKQQGQG